MREAQRTLHGVSMVLHEISVIARQLKVIAFHLGMIGLWIGLVTGRGHTFYVWIKSLLVAYVGGG